MFYAQRDGKYRASQAVTSGFTIASWAMMKMVAWRGRPEHV
jgi:hypothetical protein